MSNAPTNPDEPKPEESKPEEPKGLIEKVGAALPIGLIELEEGTRVVANLSGLEREDIEIGMALQAEFVDFDEDLSLPVFVPALPAGGGA